MAASNLTIRLATAVVMIPLLLALLFYGPAWGWLVFILLVGVVSSFEAFGMSHPGDRAVQLLGVLPVWAMIAALYLWPAHPRILLTTALALPFCSLVLSLWRLGEIPAAAMRLAWGTFSPLWVGAGLGSIVALRVWPQGASYVVLTLVISWMSDTGGYFAGRALGKRKLYEAVSPNKTVEGAVGGVVGAVIGVLVARSLLVPELPLVHAVALAAAGSVAGVLGDLGESLMKRSVGVKDSGVIVPGHGGILDRIDAVIVTAPLVFLYLIWFSPAH